MSKYHPHTTWPDEHNESLRQSYGHDSVRVIAKRLGRTKNSVIGRARRLGLHKHTRAEVGLKSAITRKARFALLPPLAPEHKPVPPQPPARVAPTDPAALIAGALIAAAKKAESRNVAMRTGRRL